MTTRLVVRQGRVRVYHVPFVPERTEHEVSAEVLPGVGVVVRLSPKPRFGHFVQESTRISRGKDGMRVNARAAIGRGGAHPIPGEMILEIFAFREVEVAGPPPPKVGGAQRARVIRELTQKDFDERDIERALDITCALVGLHLDGSLLSLPISEHNVLAWGDDSEPLKPSFRLPIVRDVSVETDHMEALTDLLGPPRVALGQTQMRLALVSRWLVEAWKANDPVFRFLAYFIPMEGALQGISVPKTPTDDARRAAAEDLRSLIETHGPAERQEPMLALLASAPTGSNSLTLRFRAFMHGVEDFEALVETFSRLNRLRTRLLHGITADAVKEVRSVSVQQDVARISKLVVLRLLTNVS